MGERNKKPTITDVARKAGVSTTTVSRVLNDDISVNPALHKRVTEAVTALKYKRIRNSAGRSNFSNLVGVVVSDIVSPGISLFIRGIEEIARRNSFNIILADAQRDLVLQTQIIENLVDRKINALIIIPNSSSDTRFIDIIGNRCPYVLLNRYIYGRDDLNTVCSNNRQGAYLATKYLLDLGHREILYVDGIASNSTQRDRLAGFHDALNEIGLDVNKNKIIYGEYDSTVAYNETKTALDRGLKFTAVFSSTDSMAFGVKRALEEKGYEIPDDVSLVGYGGIELSSAISLTTVSPGAIEMGKEAASIINDLLRGTLQAPHQILHQPSLIIRGTCRKI